MSYSASGMPVTPEADPGAAFDRIFGNVASSTVADQRARIRQRQKSALDDITAEFTRLNARLGTTDRARLDAHLTAVRALEDRIARSEALTSGLHCTPPMKHAIGTAWRCSATSAGCETNNNASNETDLQDRHTIWREMTVRALACDLTRVVTVMWAPSRADTYLPWLGFAQPHHALSHDNNVPKLTTIDNWYAGLLALYIKDIKAEVDENGDSLFKNTVVFCDAETAWETVAGTRTPTSRTFSQGARAASSRRDASSKYKAGDSPRRVANSPRAMMGVATDHVGDPAYRGADMKPLTG